MDLMQLRYFQTVAQLQHLTRAADTLNLSQPALSKAISRLEDELGAQLFDRSSNRIQLNSNGRLFLGYVQRCLLELDSGCDAVRSQNEPGSGNVGIMTSCSGLMQAAIRSFLSKYPSIRYQQYRFDSRLIADQLESGTADFAVTTLPISSTKFSWERLARDELYLVAPPDSPLSQRPSLSIQDLAHEPLIVSNSMLSVHDIVVQGFSACGLVPQIRYELNNPPLVRQLLQEGRGVTFVPGLQVEPYPHGVGVELPLIPLRDHPFQYELGILRLRNHFESRPAGLLLRFLKDWYSDPARYAGGHGQAVRFL